MKSIIELISEIENRPSMYLGKPYITCLSSYLDGWLAAKYELLTYDKNFESGFEFNTNTMSGFQNFIANKFIIKSSHSWANIILFYSSGETDALNKFFKYFNEYLTHSIELE